MSLSSSPSSLHDENKNNNDDDQDGDVLDVPGVESGVDSERTDEPVALAVPPIEPVNHDPQPPTEASQKPRRWLKRVIGFTGLAVVLGGLGLGAYLAWPSINERYITPVETTAADLTTVQERLDESDTRLASIDTQLAKLETRATAAEAVQSDTTGRLDEIDQLIEGQTSRIDSLDELAATLGDDLLATNANAARQLGVTKATELMLRARLFLYQANYGLAVNDLTLAQQALVGIEDDDPTIQAQITQASARLGRAIESLPDFPVAAAGDLDIAWQLLLGPEMAFQIALPAAPIGGVAEATDDENDAVDGSPATEAPATTLPAEDS